MVVRCLAVAVGLVWASAAAGAPAEDAQLAVRARAILLKHCAACHGGKTPRSTLQVAKYSQMVAERPTRFVAPRQPDLSQALEFVEEGSMPPGRLAKLTADEQADLRAWVKSGAAAYPERFDDEFAHTAILADVRTIRNELELTDSRYLSIHHLADTQSPAELAKSRADFLAGLRDLRIPGAPNPVAVDPTHTIYRMRLSDSGWQHGPFRKILGKNRDEELKTDLFDLVLLEYPFAVIPEGSDTFAELASRFLDKVQQVRPVAFVRGDWFVSVASSRPLVTDLYDLMKPYEVNLPATLVRHATQPERKPEPLEPYPGPGVRLPALDAWFEPDPPPGHSSVRNLTVETFPAVVNTPVKTFHPGDTFRLRISADEIMNYQYVWIDSARKVDTPSDVKKYQGLGLTPDIHVLPVTLPGEKTNVIAPVKKPETEQIRVFGSPRQLDVGARWRARLDQRVVERYVHPFFPLKKTDDRVTVDVRDAQIVRRTVTIEIVPKK